MVLITFDLLEETVTECNALYEQLEKQNLPESRIDALVRPMTNDDLVIYNILHSTYLQGMQFVSQPPNLKNIAKVVFFDMSNRVPSRTSYVNFRNIGYSNRRDFARAVDLLLNAHNAHYSLPQLQ